MNHIFRKLIRFSPYSIGIIIAILLIITLFLPISQERILNPGTDTFEAHYPIYGDRTKSQDILISKNTNSIGAILVNLHRSRILTPVTVTVRALDGTLLIEQVIPENKIKDDHFAWVYFPEMQFSEQLVSIEYAAPEATKNNAIGIRFDMDHPDQLALAVYEKAPLWRYFTGAILHNKQFPMVGWGLIVAFVISSLSVITFWPRSPTVIPADLWDEKYSNENVSYNQAIAEQYRKQGIWKLLIKHLTPHGHYLDVGCGMGGWMLFLRDQGFNVDGCDITPHTIARLKKYDPSLKVQVAGILNIPYPKQSLDGVLAIGILEYIENQVPEALAEVNRVLKPGGVFFIEVPILNTLRAFTYAPLKKIERALRILQGRQPIFAHYFFSRSELKRLLSEQGFTIIETAPHEIPEPDRHFGLYTDWPFLRGKGPRQLNVLGILLKRIFNSISPWIASQGILIVTRKQ